MPDPLRDNEFRRVVYEDRDDWGEPIRVITKVGRGRSGNLERFYVKDYGWLSKQRAIRLVALGEIDNAVLVQPRNGEPYLRARPDSDSGRNFQSMVT